MLPTFSRLQLAFDCLGSCVLPHQKDDAGEAAQIGTACHTYLDQRLSGLSEGAALASVPEEYRDSVAGRNWDEALSMLGTATSEVAYAFDGTTGSATMLGDHLGRNYGAHALTSFVGSADYVLVDNGCVEIVDLKTGNTHVSASGNWQLRGLAVAAARHHELQRARIVILTVQEGRACRWESVDLDALSLEEDALLLQGLYADIIRAQAEYQMTGTAPRLSFGRHCKYCPARQGCPEYAQKAAAILKPPSQPYGIEMSTRDQRTRVYHQLRNAESVIADIKKQLVAHAMHEPIEVSPGVLYGPRETTRETIDGARAREIINRRYGAETADRVGEFSVTKASLKRGFGKSDKEALELLRAEGAVEKKTTSRIDEYKGELAPLAGDS